MKLPFAVSLSKPVLSLSKGVDGNWLTVPAGKAVHGSTGSPTTNGLDRDFLKLQVQRPAQPVHHRRQPAEVLEDDFRQLRRQHYLVVQRRAGDEILALDILDQLVRRIEAARR